MLIILGGLPGTGKTTIARELARRCAATWLRIDAIEQAVRDAKVLAAGIGPAGYTAAYALAEVKLKLGRRVVADCVNPLPETRAAWRQVAASASVPWIEIEVICSDAAVHRRRVESRVSDIPGLVPPTWESVLRHDYVPWSGDRLVIDTARLSAAQAAALIAARIPGNSVVLDTNIALDLLLFNDPACAPLAAALQAGRLRWLATAAMRAEFARVLAYPAIASRLALQGRDAAAVLSAFDALAHPTEPAAPAPCRCSDPDDQIFIDLAVAHRALPLSKDQAVLSMRKVLETLAVHAQAAINSIADEGPASAAPATGRRPYRGS